MSVLPLDGGDVKKGLCLWVTGVTNEPYAKEVCEFATLHGLAFLSTDPEPLDEALVTAWSTAETMKAFAPPSGFHVMILFRHGG